MNCSRCGAEIHRGERSMIETQFNERGWADNNKNSLVAKPVLLCANCIAERQATRRLYLGVVILIVIAVIVAILIR